MEDLTKGEILWAKILSTIVAIVLILAGIALFFFGDMLLDIAGLICTIFGAMFLYITFSTK